MLEGGIGMEKTSVQGKVGVVTGGTSGFGLEVVLDLQRQGADLAVFSIDEPSDDTLERVSSCPTGSVTFFVIDLLNESSGREIVRKTVERYGTVDFVFANAGFAIRFDKPLTDYPSDEVVKALKTQYQIFPIAFLSLALEAAQVMKEKYRNTETDTTGHRMDSGSIIVTLSEASLSNLRADLLAYAAAKKSTQWIMESLAVSLAPYNIRVNGIAPGFANNEGQKKFYGTYPEIRKDVENLCHLKPAFMHPHAITPAVRYLLSDHYVTGQTIILDGGYSLHTFSYFTE